MERIVILYQCGVFSEIYASVNSDVGVIRT